MLFLLPSVYIHQGSPPGFGVVFSSISAYGDFAKLAQALMAAKGVIDDHREG